MKSTAQKAGRPRTVADFGENRLITDLMRGFPTRRDVRAGVGDDCAVIGSARDPQWRLFKTDSVIESVHFVPEEDLRRVGWKALCRPISDIAAMGGVPEHALVTLAAPATMAVTRARALYAGIRRAALAFKVAVVGGETSRSPGPIFISIALMGSVESHRCIRRSGGKAGDALFVTGWLGGSAAGRHLDFHPRVTEARWLTGHFKVHAMMDLSDGLASDLPRLASASACHFALWKDQLPKSKGCTTGEALSDGEDYELLFALPLRDAAMLQEQWPRAFPKLPLTQVGVLLPGPPIPTLPLSGYDHFAHG